jgi:hypothetical protein
MTSITVGNYFTNDSDYQPRSTADLLPLLQEIASIERDYLSLGGQRTDMYVDEVVIQLDDICRLHQIRLAHQEVNRILTIVQMNQVTS